MTRKDYELIARVFAAYRKELDCMKEGTYRDHADTVSCVLATDMATALEADNPRFDPTRFLKACGVA